MKSLAKNVVFTILRLIRPGLSGASILMYHSVGDNRLFFTVRPEEFRRQMEYLRRKKYEVRRLTNVVKDLNEGRPIKPCVIITFDDGYKDFIAEALPVLKQYELPATIFIPTGLIGSSNKISGGVSLPIMDENDVKTAAATGLVDFMPHTVSHRSLDVLQANEQSKELEQSLAALRRFVPVLVPVIAYPKGKYTAQTVACAKQLGYRAAVTVREGIIRAGDDPFALKRDSIDSSTTFGQFKAKLSDAVEAYESLKTCL